MANKRDLYQVLGVSRSATPDDIKKSYRKLAKELHPDVNPGNRRAEQRFKEITAAHEVLSDPDKRKLYDEFGDIGLRQGFNPAAARAASQFGGGFRMNANPFDSTDDMFSQYRYSGDAGGFRFEDLIEQMFNSASQKRSSRTSSRGSPFTEDVFDNETFSRSSTSRGRSRSRRSADPPKVPLEIDLLESIRGVERSVTVSLGQGETRSVRVRVPAGVKEGEAVRVGGAGTPDSYGTPTDILLEIRIRPHPRLRRIDDDLELDLPVTVLEAYAGADVLVPTPDGPVKIKLPAASRSGMRLRLKGRGVGRAGGPRGDFYAIVQVQVPDGQDPRVREALAQAESAYTRPVREDLVL